MKRVMLRVAYDGTNYCGWQIQNNGITIEEVLNRELTRLLGEEIKVTGASRTDSGVHALGNVAVFSTDTRIPADKISFALNQRLPDDIVIQESKEVESDFHPRYARCEKIYEYRILNRRFPLPSERFNSHFFHYKLDIDKMRQAAKYIIGEHDFKCFCAAGAQVKTTVRTIYALDISENNGMVTIRIRGNGFLYNMVRIIAGTLIKVGNGDIEPEYIKEIIASKKRENAGPTAPANGLTLVKIRYIDMETD